jgi:hypothetical protein
MSDHLIKDFGDLAMLSGNAKVRRAMRKQDVAGEDGSLGTVTSRLPRTWLSEIVNETTRYRRKPGSPVPVC